MEQSPEVSIWDWNLRIWNGSEWGISLQSTHTNSSVEGQAVNWPLVFFDISRVEYARIKDRVADVTGTQ